MRGSGLSTLTHDQLAESDLDLTYCGAKDKVMMIEGTADEMPEAEFIEAMQTAHKEVEKIIDAQLKLRADLGLPEKVYAPEASDTTLLDKARELAGEKFIELDEDSWQARASRCGIRTERRAESTDARSVRGDER